MSPSNPEGIRVGDLVQVLQPNWVKRVGYPLHWRDLMEEVSESEAVQRAYSLLTGIPHPRERRGLLASDKFMPEFWLQAVAKLFVELRGFGGKVRSIHYYGSDELDTCSLVEVTGKRTVYTGTRVPPSHGFSSYDEEPWCDPGYLKDSKAHVLLTTCFGEIEAINVKLIKRGNMYTTQREVRRAFWAAHPQADRRRITNYSGNGTMYPTDTRCAFVDFVDALSKSGEISQELAGRVTLG